MKVRRSLLTGLKGFYSFKLKWTPENLAGNGSQSPTLDLPGPPFFTALQEQLGLKLEKTKAPAKFILIEHIEQPSEN
jgi:uncharacterized protein (TIGR03435 family)